MDRFQQQLGFLTEIDKLKSITRQTLLMDGETNENDAEHSWHLAMAVMILHEHGEAKHVDLLKVMKMVLIHDIVEIDAGDTYAYDEGAHYDKEEREQKAAKRLFGLLPEDQAAELRLLWEEFEAVQTSEAKLANALDRFMPMWHNYQTKGKQWQKHGVTQQMVLKRNESIKYGSTVLWEFAKQMVTEAVEKGYLQKETRP